MRPYGRCDRAGDGWPPTKAAAVTAGRRADYEDDWREAGRRNGDTAPRPTTKAVGKRSSPPGRDSAHRPSEEGRMLSPWRAETKNKDRLEQDMQKLYRTAAGEPSLRPLNRGMCCFYLIETLALASSSSFLSFSASDLEMPSLTFVGAASTKSLASLRPRPVAARTTLMTPILFSPKFSRMTSNYVFSAAASAAAPPAPPGAAIITAPPAAGLIP